MRFCLLTTFYPPFNFGGDGIDVQRTARALAARGHDVTVVHDVDAYEWLSGRRLPDPPERRDGVRVIGLRSRLGIVSPLLTHQLGRPVVHGRRLARMLDGDAFDVVVFNNVSLVGGPGLLALGGRATKIYVAHEHWLVCASRMLWRFNREPCDHRACFRCVLHYHRPPQLWRQTNLLERHLDDIDLFIARSAFSRDKHREFGFPKPMAVLPYFLPGPFPAERPVAQGPSPHPRPYFLFVGRLTRIKGVHTLIPAFRRYPDADLVIIGDGEELDALRDAARDAPNVRFLGRVPNEDLAPYYAHAIASIASSTGFETFGIVLIESFRHGTPVIARRLGPFPEIVEESGGGLLFTTTEELLEAMAHLQRDPAAREQMAASGFDSCRTRWSEAVVIDRYLALVEETRAARR